MTITILNIFIGVVGMSYEKALDEAERSFQCQRAKASLNHVAHMKGLRTVLCCRRKRPEWRKDVYAWYIISLDEETLNKEFDVPERRADNLDERVGRLAMDVSRMGRQLEGLVEALRPVDIALE